MGHAGRVEMAEFSNSNAIYTRTSCRETLASEGQALTPPQQQNLAISQTAMWAASRGQPESM
jgi:hypothetical protein